MTGSVYKSTRSWYTVKTQNGKTFECRIKGKKMISIQNNNEKLVNRDVNFIMDELKIGIEEATGILNKYRSVKETLSLKRI